MAYTPGVNVFNRRAHGIDSHPLNSLASTQKLLTYYQSISKARSYLSNPLNHSQYSAILTQNASMLKLNELAAPGFVDHDRLLYHYDNGKVERKKENFATTLNLTLTSSSLNLSLSVYKILINLTLLRI